MAKKITIKDNSQIYIEENASNTICLIIENNEVNINYSLKDGDYKILVFNNAKADVSLKETGDVINSSVIINYVELNEYNFKQDCHIEVYQNASLNVNSIYLGISNKYVNFDLVNNEPDSHIEITNNVVCLKDADFLMNVIGTIKKGAKRSTCHQKSHCLTIDVPKQSKILPILKIDENDVEASHSLSCGTIDEEILFYMNARGLTKKESLLLMVKSYLLPEEELYKEYDVESLKAITDERIERLCLK